MAESRGATSVEVYGFVGWITSAVAYVIFLFWAYTPNEYLKSVGITYYPDKYWAVALPVYACICCCFVLAAYESLNMMSVPAVTSRQQLQDRCSKFSEHCTESSWQAPTSAKIPALTHIPPQVASRLLYSAPDGTPS